MPFDIFNTKGLSNSPTPERLCSRTAIPNENMSKIKMNMVCHNPILSTSTFNLVISVEISFLLFFILSLWHLKSAIILTSASSSPYNLNSLNCRCSILAIISFLSIPKKALVQVLQCRTLSLDFGGLSSWWRLFPRIGCRW